MTLSIVPRFWEASKGVEPVDEHIGSPMGALAFLLSNVRGNPTNIPALEYSKF
eukprot:CAMPEP_0119027912 /NCGR_PEP_ID=MMETSP1176-20130426/37960_1 /TAXON_ID=265551 /ORGANISM="Synedropsis recta cf, Strain CCMP1620" /LENGTH=52 /DNA_ID=CAMNT_0006983933 /DNA_START=67 /DNA_END=225 /DNA_ORIENTATION=+